MVLIPDTGEQLGAPFTVDWTSRHPNRAQIQALPPFNSLSWKRDVAQT
jgi:hypothetical protein